MMKNSIEKYNIGDKVGSYGIWKGFSRGKYDIRNKINNLTGKEWIRNTASVWEYEDDHRINLCKDIIGMFTTSKLHDDILVINDNADIINNNLVNEVYTSLEESKPLFKIKKFKNTDLTFINEDNKYQLTLSFIDDSIFSNYDHLSSKQPIKEYEQLLNEQKDSYSSILYSITKSGRYSIVVLNELNVNGIRIDISNNVTRAFQNVGFEYRGKITSFDIATLNEDNGYKGKYDINNIHTYILVFYKPKRKEEIIYGKRCSETRDVISINASENTAKQIPSILYSKTKTDPIGKIHPATFSYIDVEYLIEQFVGRDKNKLIFDPFLGVSSTIIAADLTGNIGLGIELNTDYIELSEQRLRQMNINNFITIQEGEITNFNTKFHYLLEDDSLNRINQEDIPVFDYCITSPPYHNILRNNGNGVRSDKSQFRQGIEYYSELDNDLGNQDSFEKYLELFSKVMTATFQKLKNNGYCSVIISDFTVDKKEVDVSGEIIQLMRSIGYKYLGAIMLIQPHKVIYPFGYPYKFVLNHVNQFILNFRK